MRFRKLRIAWSLGWGSVGLLLVAAWIRSGHVADTALVQVTATRAIQVDSARGVLSLESLFYFDEADPFETEFVSEPISKDLPDSSPSPSGLAWEVARGADGGSHTLSVPHWILVLLSAAFGAAPWIRWRFRLRTLLIAMALVAVAMGLITYAMRR